MRRKLYLFVLIFQLSLCGLLSQPKKTISVLNLDPNGLTNQEAKIITDRIRSTLPRLGVYNVQERAKMEAIFDEMKFQLSGCASEECVVQAGQLLGAEKMLYGSVGHLGNFFTLELMILDVETGSIEQTCSYEVQGDIGKLLKGAEEALSKLLDLEYSGDISSGVNQPTSNPMQSAFTGIGGRLDIETSPTGASVFLDGEELGKTPLTKQNIRPGPHVLLLRLQNYQDYSQSIQMESGEIEKVDCSMNSVFGELQIKIQDQPEIEILFNEEQVNLGDFPIRNLAQGVYPLTILCPGFFPIDTTVAIFSNEIAELQIDLERNSAELIVYTIPEQATIIINNTQYDESPVSVKNNKLGSHFEIEISKDYFYTITDSFQIVSAKQIDKQYILEPRMGTLRIDTDFDDLKLSINNQTIGQYTNPIEWQEGSHLLKATKDGYYPYEELVFIPDNGMVSRRIKLKYALQDHKRYKKHRNYAFIATIGAAAISLYASSSADQAYDWYSNASTMAQAAKFKKKTQNADILFMSALIASAGAGTYTVFLHFKISDIQKLAGLKP